MVHTPKGVRMIFAWIVPARAEARTDARSRPYRPTNHETPHVVCKNRTHTLRVIQAVAFTLKSPLTLEAAYPAVHWS